LFVVVDISSPIVNYWAELCFAAVVFTKCVLFVNIWWQHVCYLLRNGLCLNIVLCLLLQLEQNATRHVWYLIFPV
jgi:hypothetical protein